MSHSPQHIRTALRSLPFLLTLSFNLLMCAHAQDAPPATAILFKNVRVFDGNASAVTPPSDVLVEKDTIAEISTTSIAPPQGYQTKVIHGEGRVLMPGLIDVHWHAIAAAASPADREEDYGLRYILASEEAKQTILRGFTVVRDMGGPSFGLKKAIDRGIINGPRMYPSGAMISQTGGHGDQRPRTELNPRFGGGVPASELFGDSIIADGRDEVLAAAREQLRLGASQIKLATTGGILSTYDPIDSLQFTSDEIKAAVQAASDWGTYVTVHCYSAEGARRAIDAGVKVIEHGQLLDEATIKLIAEKGIWLSIQPFPPVAAQGAADAQQTDDPTVAKRVIVHAGTDNVYRLAKLYHVKIAFGTDLNGGFKRAALQNDRLVSLTKWFTAPELLHIATAANGELLALSGKRNPYPKKIGVIETGAYADLLLVNGNPLEDINLISTPENSFAVIVKNGVIVKNTLATSK